MSTKSFKDITERLDIAADEVRNRDALYGMSSSAILQEAKEEILRLREELVQEMRNTAILLRRAAK
tara:strand:- start:473 stop:670 length:198 start_codon:yes stop_codon:yes gene_type:complete